MDLFYKVRQVNRGRTHRLASLTVEAVFDDGPSVLPSVIKICQYESDGADVNMAVVMAADKFIDWAHICACAAADAP